MSIQAIALQHCEVVVSLTSLIAWMTGKLHVYVAERIVIKTYFKSYSCLS